MNINDKILREYIKNIKNEMIPELAPYTECSWETGLHEEISVRSEVTDTGLWVKISRKYFTDLLKHVENNKVLEVMAGAGWFGKGLSELGVDIHCTDDFSWEKPHKNLNVVFPVEKLDAVNAVKKYKNQFNMLLISWPPYGDETILEVCKEWGTNNPIIYVGEGDGGCNAPEEFFTRFEQYGTVATDNWLGLHDRTQIGYYK